MSAATVDPEKLADALVEDLFRNGAGLEGERLAIMAGGIDHGGWSRDGFRSRVLKIIGEATAAAPDQESTGKSVADRKIEHLVEESKAETARGREARRK